MKTADIYTNKVFDYIKYRPTYPREVLDTLIKSCKLNPGKIIADIGSGTGIFAKLILEKGCKVFGVEPNDAMREQAEVYLLNYPNFKSINATAENTTLLNSSIDLIVSAQAFHWFNHDKAKIEFKRILKPESYVALIWNERKTDGSAFLEEFEGFIEQFGENYIKSKQYSMGNAAKLLFGINKYNVKKFNNFQNLDYDGLRGRFLSCSYAPCPSNQNYNSMLKSLKDVYEKYSSQHGVQLVYETHIYFGKL